MLDISAAKWYHSPARFGEDSACNAMMQEIALKNGNFCGVCPVIGRLRQSVRGVYRRGMMLGRQTSVFFHVNGVIRTVKRTGKCLDRTQQTKKN